MLRRDFLKLTLAAAASAPSLLPGTAFAQSNGDPNQHVPTVLWVKRDRDEARLDFSTRDGYQYIAWLLRDVRAGQTGIPDWRLLQLLSWMQAWLAAFGHHVRLDIHSGLRTHKTNSRIEGAAQASLHLPDEQGIFKATDFSTKSISSDYMGRLAALAQQGGVGFYTSRHFTHVDTGRLRYWRAK